MHRAPLCRIAEHDREDRLHAIVYNMFVLKRNLPPVLIEQHPTLRRRQRLDHRQQA